MWVTVVAVIGIMTYAEMSARVAVVTKLPAFDVVRSRTGARLGLAATGGSFLATFLALIAELAGVALAIELLTSVSYLLFIPLVAAVMFVLIWRVPFEIIERIYGVLGLALLSFVVAVWQLGPDWGELAHQVVHPPLPSGEGLPTYFFYAIVMLGAQMTPYEVIFFSSEAVEKNWTTSDLFTARLNVFIGFSLGGRGSRRVPFDARSDGVLAALFAARLRTSGLRRWLSWRRCRWRWPAAERVGLRSTS
jgi:Mn2+/Fe2+ NRAMP family transporter